MGAQHTRRALIVSAAALPAVIVTPIHAEPIGQGEAWRLKKRDFIERVAGLHHAPHGRYVATKAMAMDLDPDDCVLLQFYDREAPGRMPALHFQPANRARVTVVVDRQGAYEHGPCFSGLEVL